MSLVLFVSDPFNSKEIGAAPLPEPREVDPSLEYVSGGSGLWSKTHARSLPWAFDELTADFGDDLYQRMLLDPQVIANTNVLKTAIIEDGVQVTTAIADRDDARFDDAETVRQFVEDDLGQLDTPLDDVLWDMLDALPLGARVAEKVFREAPIAGKQHYRALKVKPRRSTAFVVDAYMNVLGLLALIPGMGYGVQVGTTIVGDPARQPQLLRPDKFAVLTNRPHNNDPRGTSILRPAYGVWWMKQQVWPEYLKYLAVWATPSLIGTTGEKQIEVLDQVTGVKLPAVQALLNSLIAFKNNSALAVPYGTMVREIQASGTGEVFKFAVEILDRQITTAMLGQTLATMEGQHQSRAASNTHENTLDTFIRQIKRALCNMLRRHVFATLIENNFGPQAAQALTPYASLGTVEQPDRPAMMTAVAALQTSGYLAQSQLPELDTQLGLPARDPDEEPAAPAQQPSQGGQPGQDTQKEPANGSNQK